MVISPDIAAYTSTLMIWPSSAKTFLALQTRESREGGDATYKWMRLILKDTVKINPGCGYAEFFSFRYGCGVRCWLLLNSRIDHRPEGVISDPKRTV